MPSAYATALQSAAAERIVFDGSGADCSLPGVSAELKRNAEDQLATRLPQLPLGQKITLARRGPARVAGSLLAEGHPLVVPVALDNSHLTAAQILKALAREAVPESVVQAIAQHRKWSCDYNVRLALVRNPATTLATSLSFLPELTVSDLHELAAPGVSSPSPCENILRLKPTGAFERAKSRPLVKSLSTKVNRLKISRADKLFLPDQPGDAILARKSLN